MLHTHLPNDQQQQEIIGLQNTLAFDETRQSSPVIEAFFLARQIGLVSLSSRISPEPILPRHSNASNHQFGSQFLEFGIAFYASSRFCHVLLLDEHR